MLGHAVDVSVPCGVQARAALSAERDNAKREIARLTGEYENLRRMLTHTDVRAFLLPELCGRWPPHPICLRGTLRAVAVSFTFSGAAACYGIE